MLQRLPNDQTTRPAEQHVHVATQELQTAINRCKPGCWQLQPHPGQSISRDTRGIPPPVPHGSYQKRTSQSSASAASGYLGCTMGTLAARTVTCYIGEARCPRSGQLPSCRAAASASTTCRLVRPFSPARPVHSIAHSSSCYQVSVFSARENRRGNPSSLGNPAVPCQSKGQLHTPESELDKSVGNGAWPIHLCSASAQALQKR